MGLFDFLSSTPPPAQPIRQTNQLRLTGPAAGIAQQATQAGQSLISNPPLLPDVAPFDPLQVQAQNQYLGAAGGPIQDLATQAAGAESFLLNPAILEASSNPALQSYIDAALEPITTNYTQNVVPGSQIEAIGGTGLGGGSRAGVREANDVQNYLRQLGNTTASIAYPAYAKGLDVMGSAIARAPQTAGFQLLPGSVSDVVGNQRRDLVQQQQQTDLVNQFLPFLIAQDVSNFATGVPGAVKGITTLQGAAPPTNPQGGAIGLGTMAGTILGSIFGAPTVGGALGGLAGAAFS